MTNQLAIVSIQLKIVTCPTQPAKLIRHVHCNGRPQMFPAFLPVPTGAYHKNDGVN